MLYDISLTITYAYDNPAAAGRHLLRLKPADLALVQRRVATSLSVTPDPSERIAFTDFWGNEAEEVVLREAHDKIVFHVSARIERFASAPELDISPRLPRLAEEIADWRGLEPRAPHHFLGPSPRLDATTEMTAYARDLVRPDMTALDAVRTIGEALHRDMKFDPEATSVDTPAGEAFARRHGVCQDFAQIMIACLRGIGVPAGYVSGFLRTVPPPGKPRLAGADAMHAWVRAWCGRESGWIEYDPTNAVAVGANHVEIARGRDYGDVSPVVGILRIAGSQTTKQAVDVLPLGES